MWGLWGRPRLRPGRRRSGQPRQPGHRLRRQAAPLGSAYALAARRSGAAALAASSGQAGPRPAACGLAPAGARNLYRRAHWRRKRRLPRASRAAGRGERRLRAGCRPEPRPARPRQAPRRAASRPQAGALPAGAPASEKNCGGCPAFWRFTRPLSTFFGDVSMFAVACRVSSNGRVWWLVSRGRGLFGWSLSRSSRSLWPTQAAANAACSALAASAPRCFWPVGAASGRLAVVRCG